MALTLQLTPGDLREAVAANRVWMKLDGRADGPAKWVGILAIWLPALAIAAMTFVPEMPGDYRWRVTPRGLLVGTLAVPAVLAVLVLQAMVRLRPGTRTFTGITHAGATSSGGRVGKVIGRALLVLIFLFTFYTVLGMLAAKPVRYSAAGNPLSHVLPAGDDMTVSSFAVFSLNVWPTLVLLFALATIHVRLQRRALERGNPTVFEPRTLQLDAEGLTILDANGHVRTRWSGIRRFMETPNLVLLYPTHQTFHVLPKRDLHAAGELEPLMAMLVQHVPTGVLQPRGVAAFPVQPVGGTAVT